VTTLDFSHNLDALGRCVERRQTQIATQLSYPCDVTFAFDDLWTTKTGSFFNPPPPMSDLLGEVPRG
jgi:hypothetical protein